MGYTQCSGDHTVFYRHSGRHITILSVYLDDIIITGDDSFEMSELQQKFGKEFEVKDLGQLRYFLGIEIPMSPKGIVLSQRKFVLNLLSDVGMLGCRVASTPIEKNHQLCAQSVDPVDIESYQRLVGRLIYLCHTRPYIIYAVSVVSPTCTTQESAFRGSPPNFTLSKREPWKRFIVEGQWSLECRWLL
jgi:hypothetical protein